MYVTDERNTVTPQESCRVMYFDWTSLRPVEERRTPSPLFGQRCRVLGADGVMRDPSDDTNDE